MSDADDTTSRISVPPSGKELTAMIAMIDYIIPECRGVSPVTTVLLSLARRELVTLQLNQQEAIVVMARDA
jgi:hypothetical protein